MSSPVVSVLRSGRGAEAGDSFGTLRKSEVVPGCAGVFAAFDPFHEHLYEFQIGGKKPMDPRATRYGLPEPPSPFGPRDPVRSAARTKLDSLGLEVGDGFGYWFDFGDDWSNDLTAIVSGRDRKRFEAAKIDLMKLKGVKVRLRGWVERGADVLA